MNRDELLQLREKIVGQTREIVLRDDGDPASKLEVLMSLIASGDVSAEVMNSAYVTAQQLPEDANRLDAFLDLIYEIDVHLSGGPGSAPEVSQSD